MTERPSIADLLAMSEEEFAKAQPDLSVRRFILQHYGWERTARTMTFEVDVPCLESIGGDDDFSIPLDVLIADLRAAWGAIPEGSRSRAVFRVRASGEYASASAAVEYQRDESPEEVKERMAKRRQEIAAQASQAEERERAEYERLRSKFEGAR